MFGWKHRLCLVLVPQVLLVTVCSGITMDELIADAAETPQELFAMPLPSGQGDNSGSAGIRMEMDIVYTPEQFRQVQQHSDQVGQDGNRRRKRRKAIRGRSYRWLNAIIPYDYDSHSNFSPQDREVIESAIEEWRTHTCLRFVQADHHHTNRVRFTNGGGCFSNVGMVGNAQVIGLAKGCRHKSVVIHELGHAVGFQHEQTRPDRDQHVAIVTQNIPPTLLYNFGKYNRDIVELLGTPYDYHSIMHYGKKAFSYNQQLTIKTHNPAYQDVIGTATGLSFIDIKQANLMYQCHDDCRQKVQCPPHGFVDKHCQCLCPGKPTQPCSHTGSGSISTSPTSTSSESGNRGHATVTSGSGCKDQYDQCPDWARRGECTGPTNKRFMEAYCRQSCKLCEHHPDEDEKGVNDCKDNDKSCEFWKGEGHCTDEFRDYMKITCPKICGHCNAGADRDRHRYSADSGIQQSDDVDNSGVTSQAMTSLQMVLVGVTFALVGDAITFN